MELIQAVEFNMPMCVCGEKFVVYIAGSQYVIPVRSTGLILHVVTPKYNIAAKKITKPSYKLRSKQFF